LISHPLSTETDSSPIFTYPTFRSLQFELKGKTPFDIDGPLLADHVFEAPLSALDELGTRPIDPLTKLPLTDREVQCKILEMEDRIAHYRAGLKDLEDDYRMGEVTTTEMYSRRGSLDAMFNHSSIESFEEGNFDGALKESAMRIMLGGFKNLEREGLLEGLSFGGEERKEAEGRLEDIRLGWAGREGNGRWSCWSGDKD
jgi:hypothetical protein